MDVYHPARWIEDHMDNGIRLVPPGVYDDALWRDPGTHWPDGSILVPYDHAAGLIPFLEARGIIAPRLDERLRVEDLRITHRLIDLLEQVSPGERKAQT